ncbi:flagellar basal body-associated protein FliL [Terrilactibacillus sp. BCM23-1]|uniref:Flagellar protein FliL n=1 Tax=Terrilactibacillus tamarindi TaxID=2599694 RepID=A0A6N8CQG1_9BACI|nr:flagellar basal body-associated FliL family protein [Terrilactibacillus tamarindi]MTT32271.1 flagellar basal body-associated protein FliL [Terrilactibacillus tamarindi]
MFKSKGMNILFTIMAIFIFVAVAGFFVVNMMHQNKTSAQKKDVSIDTIVNDLTIDTDEITTNMKDSHFANVQFKIQVSNKDAKEELTKREFQVKNAIILTLSSLTPNDLQGSKGIDRLQQLIKDQINAFLKSGRVVNVYTTKKLIQ